MKILLIAIRGGRGAPGVPPGDFSYEYYNFFNTLKNMDNKRHAVEYFPYDELTVRYGKEKMNRLLLDKVTEDRPDLCFFVYSHEIKKDTVKEIRKRGILTYNWFTDDIWRFDSFSKHYAWLFDYVSTTDSVAFRRYGEIGYRNAIKTQFGCNHFLYRPVKARESHGVSFVGQGYGGRSRTVEGLSRSGIDTECWGIGWKNGAASQKEMIRIFSNSRINLNFSASSPSTRMTLKDFGAIFLRKEMDNRKRFYDAREWIPRFMLKIKKQTRRQIKGRTFEISGCGGFQLCEYADDIENYYVPGKEIAIFDNSGRLAEEVGYYLENDKERKKIALGGYKRTIRDHTYERRFNAIFKTMGL